MKYIIIILVVFLCSCEMDTEYEVKKIDEPVYYQDSICILIKEF